MIELWELTMEMDEIWMELGYTSEFAGLLDPLPFGTDQRFLVAMSSSHEFW